MDQGPKATRKYISNTYGSKQPRGVLSRIKKLPGFEYDTINKKIIKSDAKEEKIFMDLDELCNNINSNGIRPSYKNNKH